MASGVYKITSPSKKIYVGSSINIKKRWRAYKALRCKSQIRLYSSFLKYGVKNHVFEVITECDQNEMLSIELHWGLFYNSLDDNSGLNCKLPKEGDSYGGCSEISKRRMSESSKGQKSTRKGIPLPLETRLKISESLKRRRNTPWNKGKKFSAESKKKMSESTKGQISAQRKIVLDLSTGVFYNSAIEAANLNGFKRTTLQAMLSGQNRNKTNLIYV